MRNIEEDIKRCEKLTEPQNANWIGISNQLAIVHLIERIKELESKLEEANKQLDLDYVDENYIPKQKIKDKIEELNKAYEDSKNEYGESEYYYPDYTITILQELLQEEDK